MIKNPGEKLGFFCGTNLGEKFIPPKKGSPRGDHK